MSTLIILNKNAWRILCSLFGGKAIKFVRYLSFFFVNIPLNGDK